MVKSSLYFTNVPPTWEEIVAIGRQITVDANGRHPGEEGFDINTVETFGVGDIWFENAVYGNDGQIVSEDGRTFVADMPETVAAVQWIADLTHQHQVHPTSQQTSSQSISQMFEAGKVAIFDLGAGGVAEWRAVCPLLHGALSGGRTPVHLPRCE